VINEVDLLAAEDPTEVLQAARAANGGHEVNVYNRAPCHDPVRDTNWLASFYKKQAEAVGETHSTLWYLVRARHALGDPVTNDTRALALQDIFPELLELFPEPPCDCEDAQLENLKWVIIHLNDEHSVEDIEESGSSLKVWTRDEIADWVESVYKSWDL
jgi:hypothetical protein